MKFAIILGAFSIGNRPLDFNSIWDNPRGMTGTELCFIMLAEELQKIGNEIWLFTVTSPDQPREYKGMRVRPFEHRNSLVDDTFDCIISINEPNVLMEMTTKPFRIVWMMLNDFSFIRPGFDEFVDLYLGVCEEHSEYMSKQTPNPDKWKTVHLGCNPDWYRDERVPGRVIWCSSADRGLHWLLDKWPHIKQKVPEASLRIFYHMNYGDIEKIEPQDQTKHYHVVEMGQRIRYIKNALERLKHLGVEYVGSVSRNQMVKEWNEASVFGFPCDTVAFSEGFSVSTLEAHASFTVPVITGCDCLGGLYKDSGAIIGSIAEPKKQYLSEEIIKALKNTDKADEIIRKCREFAYENTWEAAADRIMYFADRTVHNEME